MTKLPWDHTGQAGNQETAKAPNCKQQQSTGQSQGRETTPNLSVTPQPECSNAGVGTTLIAKPFPANSGR